MKINIDKNTAIRLVILFVVALIPRGAILATTQSSEIFTRWCPTCYDAQDYNEVAVNLIRNHTFAKLDGSTPKQPPLYSLFIAGIYSMGGTENFGAVRLAQALLSSLTVLFLSQVAYRMFGARAGWVAGVGATAYPFFVAYSVELYSETLFAFLSVGAMLLLFPYPDRPEPSLRSAIFGGILVALSALTRQAGLLLLPALLIWFWFHRRKVLSISLLAVWLTTGVIAGSWALRNYFVLGEAILISPQGYNNIITDLVDVHHYDISKAAGNIPDSVPPGTENPFAYLGQHDLVAQEKYAQSLVFSYCRLETLKCLTAWVKNFLKLVSPVIANRPGWIVAATSVAHLGAYAVGTWGMVKISQRGQGHVVLFLLAWFLLCLVATAIAHAEIRYRIPVVDPYLIVVGSYPLADVWQKIRRQQG